MLADAALLTVRVSLPSASLLRASLIRMQDFMHPAGQPAKTQAQLGWMLTLVAAAVVVIVVVLLLMAVLRTRSNSIHARQRTVDDARSDGTPLNRGMASGMRSMYAGIAITVVILAGAFTATAVALARTNHATGSPAVTIHVIAHQWWWEARYDDGNPAHNFVTANELHVPVNGIVRLTLESPDVIHSFWIPELAGKTDAIPGQTNVAWFQAERAGEFRGQCAEYCGLQHAHMASVVVADSAPAYEQWAVGQRNSAQIPADSVTRQGEQVFVRSCGACHAVRGTNALGVLGPDLTHVATRGTIAAGLLPNTRGNLVAWVQNAQALKPGVQMPPMSLPAGELNAVVLYLESLR